ncbi:MAG: putative hydrolase of the superfamily [Pseudonocardiales bacterium]|jgi:putative hydrolase of the HAD superfamily|nr:putative hydrolase of the superfamily [Pseudonocardiales bacterium]
MTIDAVLFDWGGTLTPWHTIDPFACWLSVIQDEAQAKALHEAEALVWATVKDTHRSGTMDDILSRAELVLTETQLRTYYQWWDEHSFTDPQAEPMLRELRARGIKIGILSNTVWPRAEHERIFERDAIHHLIDGSVYSSEIDWVKPHPQAFRAAMDAVGVTDPARAVFVGDRLFEDIYGAQQVGMRAVHIPHSQIPAWQTTGVEGRPDAVISELSELPAVLDGWS